MNSIANISARQLDEKESFVYTQLSSQFLSAYELSFKVNNKRVEEHVVKLII